MSFGLTGWTTSAGCCVKLGGIAFAKLFVVRFAGAEDGSGEPSRKGCESRHRSAWRRGAPQAAEKSWTSRKKEQTNKGLARGKNADS